VAFVAALAACAVIAMVFTQGASEPVELAARSLGLKQSDLDLLQGAMHSEAKEKHRACVHECTSRACKAKCSKILSEHSAKHAHKQAKVASAAKKSSSKKVSLGLKKSDIKLLADADKDQHRDQIKKCHECMTKECKDNCKDILEKAKSAKKHTSAHKAKKLGLKMSDLKLLADAQKRQKKEGAKAIYMAVS